jgi:uncharacterized protein YndB with AHSA1/START domain
MSAPREGGQASEVAAFRIERTFAASPEEVFDAWTSPDVLQRWWGRANWSPSSLDVDLRVGGGYSLRMLDADGRPHAVGGEYREVERPHRLVYTWCWEHSGLPTEGSRGAHGDGWGGALESLARQIFPDPGQM